MRKKMKIEARLLSWGPEALPYEDGISVAKNTIVERGKIAWGKNHGRDDPFQAIRKKGNLNIEWLFHVEGTTKDIETIRRYLPEEFENDLKIYKTYLLVKKIVDIYIDKSEIRNREGDLLYSWNDNQWVVIDIPINIYNQLTGD